MAFEQLRTSIRAGAVSSSALVFNAGTLVGTTVVTSILGVFYWYVATRFVAPEGVGTASAGISAMTLLATIGVFGFGTLLIGEMRATPGRAGTLLTTGALTACSSGAVLALGFLAVTAHTRHLTAFSSSVPMIAVFALGTGLTASALVIDSGVVGLMQGALQFNRNVLFAMVKLALLFTFVGLMGLKAWNVILTSWVIGIPLSFVVLTRLVRSFGRRGSLPDLVLLRTMGRTALNHHLLNLMLQMPTFTLPLIVTAILSARSNAPFSVAWNIASFAFAGPTSLGIMLYAVGAGKPHSLAHYARLTLALSIVFALGAAAILIVGAHRLLDIFGHAYSEDGTAPLRLMALAGVPLSVRVHYVAVSRALRAVTRAAIFVAAGAVLELALAAAGAWWGGIVGLSGAWLVALSVEAAVMGPIALHLSREARRNAPDDDELAVRAIPQVVA